jgi:ADP-ribose 1''-phosphate phosphatase
LSFGKRVGSALGGHDRLKKQRPDEKKEINPSKDDLKSKSPSGDDEKDQGLDKGNEVKASSSTSKANDAITSNANNPSKSPRSPTSKPATSSPSPSRLPLPKATTATRRICLINKTGDIFHSAPPKTLFIHACNTIGAWGAGIAKAFRKEYPDAYAIYRAHCMRSVPQHLVGTALLIAPRADAARQHYIGCVFTSKGHGQRRDKPPEILRATGPAMRDLLRQAARDGGVGEMRMCRINSGLFAVPWHETKWVIEELTFREEEVPGEGGPVRIVVYSPA